MNNELRAKLDVLCQAVHDWHGAVRHEIAVAEANIEAARAAVEALFADAVKDAERNAVTSGPDVTGQVVEVRPIQGGLAHVPSTGDMSQFFAGPFGYSPQLERDAARYRWLREAAYGGPAFTALVYSDTPELLDDAIDSARSAVSPEVTK